MLGEWFPIMFLEAPQLYTFWMSCLSDTPNWSFGVSTNKMISYIRCVHFIREKSKTCKVGKHCSGISSRTDYCRPWLSAGQDGHNDSHKPTWRVYLTITLASQEQWSRGAVSLLFVLNALKKKCCLGALSMADGLSWSLVGQELVLSRS